jgi:hypothetical protein
LVTLAMDQLIELLREGFTQRDGESLHIGCRLVVERCYPNRACGSLAALWLEVI